MYQRMALATLEQPVVATCVAHMLEDADARVAARDLCAFASLSRDARFREALWPWLRGYRLVVGVLDTTRAVRRHAQEDHEELSVLLGIYGDDHYTCGAALCSRVEERVRWLHAAVLELCTLIDGGVGRLAHAQWTARRGAARRGLLRLARGLPRDARRRVRAALRHLGDAGGGGELLDHAAHPRQ
jgi:hypothetical protein